MLNKMIKESIPTGIRFIKDWVDNNGNILIEPYISSGRIVVNKQATGCGFSSYCIENYANTIIVSPRIRFIQNKVEQYNDLRDPQTNQLVDPLWCFYYDRKKGDQQLSLQLTDYINNRHQMGRPMKLFVTMDSFVRFCDLLENDYGYDINSTFRIVNDESHCLITDVKMKENTYSPVIPRYLDRLFQYDNVLFLSATPIVNFISEIPQFKANPWNYLELDWTDKTVVSYQKLSCTGPKQAFKKIYEYYAKKDGVKPAGTFDVYVQPDGTIITSSNALIFLNSVKQIVDILDEYINVKHLIDVSDVSVICADRPENQQRLDKIPGLQIAPNIPKRGEYYTKWMFITSTAFEGCDFYTPYGRTYVIANYRVDNLAIDISKDLHQIAGRLRDQNNVFRDKLTIYYTQKSPISDADFTKMQNEKMSESQKQLAAINFNANTAHQGLLINNLKTVINQDPNGLYVRIDEATGMPHIENHLLIAENYGRYVFKSQSKIHLLNNGICNYSTPVENLKAKLYKANTDKDRVKLVYGLLLAFPVLFPETTCMLSKWNYQDIAWFFCRLTPDRISACGYDPWKMKQEIQGTTMVSTISNGIMQRVVIGQSYTSAQVKGILKDVYAENGLTKAAKATDLQNYIKCSSKKVNGYIRYTIDNQ